MIRQLLKNNANGDSGSITFVRSWYWWVPIVIGIIYWLVNRRFGGPAYQQDEIGYLVNAAFLAGHVVDGYSSYHAGYSFFLAPLFVMLSGPDEVWKGVLVVNALFWVGTFYLLHEILKNALRSMTVRWRTLAIIVSATYPAWVVMAGYAFSQSAFVFFYTASTLALFRWIPEKPSSVLLHSGLVGFLFWIHPTAAGVLAASIFVIGIGSWMTGQYRSLLLHLTLVFMLVIGYKAGLQVWMMNEMTPAGYVARAHYPSFATIAAAAADVRFWRDWILVVLGQFAYLTIATFGFFIAGIFQLAKTCISQNYLTRLSIGPDELRRALVSMFLLVSLLAVVTITATSFASQGHGPAYQDEWFYGRYAEAVLLPLLAVGLAAVQRRRFVISGTIAVMIIAVGVFIQSLSGSSAPLNLVNVQGFWPQSIFPKGSIVLWFALGAIALTVCLMTKRVVLFVPLLVSYLLTIQTHLQFHKNILASYSRPTAMVDFVQKNFKKGRCVGFDPYLPPGAKQQMAERIRLYSFYLFDYTFRRMSASEWAQHCNGPLFSYDSGIVAKPNEAKLIAKEPETGLLLLARGQDIRPDSAVAGSKRGPVVWAVGENEPCVLAGCFAKSSSELRAYSQVGRLEGDMYSTDGRLGYLFFGPYVSLAKGEYKLRLLGQFDNVDGAVFDIVSNHGSASHIRVNISKPATGEMVLIDFPFNLESSVNDLEVRLHVTEATKIKVRSYEIVLAADFTDASPSQTN